jgi:hypothetical protein
MLPVAVNDEDELARRVARARFDRRAVALVVRMPDDARSGRTRARTGIVVGPVVHHDHLTPGSRRFEALDDSADRQRFIFCGNDDRDGRGISHGRFLVLFACFARFVPRSRSGS